MIFDNLNDTISYADIVEEIKKVTLNNKFDLIEKLAFEISKSIFTNYNEISKINISINKPNAPIKENYSKCGVKLELTKEEFNNLMKEEL